jgi:hypothetical protein
MKVVDLQNELERIGIPQWYYSINSDVSDCYCIVHTVDVNIVWKVYYSERSKKHDVFVSENEEEACVNFLERITDSFQKYIHYGGKL